MQDVVRCLTDDGFVSRGGRGRDVCTVVFQRHIVPLQRRAGLEPVRVKFVVEYSIADAAERPGWWEAQCVGWAYDVLDGGGRPILAFHWHPRESGHVTRPHLHAYGAHESVDLHKLHPPTGHVTLSSIVRFLIEGLGVLPRRPNWQAVLDRRARV